MDLVEAINAWIDDRIVDLSDRELEQILEILDVVSASEFADLEPDHVYNRDIFTMVEAVGGDQATQTHTEDVLRAAIFGDPIPTDALQTDDAEDGLPDGAATTGIMLGDVFIEDEHDDDTDLALPSNIDDHDDDEGAELRLDIEHDSDTDHPDDTELSLDIEPDSDTDHPDDTELSLEVEDDSDTDHPDGTKLGHETSTDGDADHHDDTELSVDIEDDGFEPTEDDNAIDEVETGQLKSDHVETDQLDPGHGDTDELETGDAGDADDRMHDGFLADLTRAAAVDTPRHRVHSVAPVELRAGDELGPSFLTVSPEPAKRPSGAWKRGAVTVFMLAGLGVFAFGSVQLFGSLSESEDSVGAATAPAPTAIPTPVPTVAVFEPTVVPPETPTATPVPAPTATPPPRVGIRLDTGNVMLANFTDLAAPPDLRLIYDADADEVEPAADIIWLDDKLVIVDDGGSILVVDPSAPLTDDPLIIYEARDGLGQAVEIAPVGQDLAVRTSTGAITLIPIDGEPDPDATDFLWDASEEEVEATDLASVGELVAFVLDNGDARVVDTGDDYAITTLRAGSEEDDDADDDSEDEDAEDDANEEESKLLALSVEASSAGILVGLDDGSVSRYRLDREDVSRFDSIWDPNGDEEVSAIGAAQAGDRTALVLANGAVMLVNERGGGPRIWDSEETETLALSLVGGPNDVLVVLDSGSVLRIPLANADEIASIWDLTDDTLDPADQVALERLAAE